MPHRGNRPVDLQAFLNKATLRGEAVKYRAGQTIFSQGDPANTVFYIQKGGAKLTVLSDRGNEAVIGLLQAGVFLGEGCLAGQHVRMATASAIAPSAMLRIKQREMRRVLHREPAFSEFFIRQVLLRSVRVEADLVDQFFHSSEKRLARVLLLIAHYGNHREPKTEVPAISQGTLAEMIGTTGARVNFFMNKFRKLGFIEYNGGLKIHNSLLSVVLHD
jgi:CRP/FNR family transcriptional regulator, cyclic AMP receptor protein